MDFYVREFMVGYLIGHAPGSFSLGHLLEQKRVITFFDAQNIPHVMRVYRFNMRCMRAHAVFGNHPLEMGVVLTKLGDKALGSVALTVIFLGAILLDNRFGHERNDFALVGVDERRSQHLMGIGDGAVSVVFFQTRVAVNFVGGKGAGAIEGEEGMALDKDHLFKGFATLKVTKNRLACGSQALGLDRVEYLAHRGITRHPPNPIDALQIVLRSDLIKGEQRGGCEGEHGTGGHEGSTQGDLGIALAVLRKLTKDVLNRTQQRIGTEMFSSFGNHEAHGNPQQKVELFLS